MNEKATMIEYITSSLKEAQLGLERLISDKATLASIEKAGSLIVQSFEANGRVFSCGNGGSMCDAMHFAEELTGRYRKNRQGFPAVSISDPSHITCVANDFGYEAVFSRYVQSHGRAGDCLVAISTSGTSATVVNAARAAREMDMHVVVLTGRPGTELESLASVCICTPAGQFADRVQELHIKVLHILIELVERHFHPENYADTG